MPYAPRRRAPGRRHAVVRVRGRRVASRRRRSLRRRAGGSTLAVLALTCAVYLAWEFVGTTWVARAQQREALGDLSAVWGAGTPTVVTRGVAVDGIVRIPRFGSAYAVPLVEGTGPESLALGVGHVPETAHPGQVGNLVLAGHRVTHGQPFRRLPELRPGDEVVIETMTTEYVYRVTSGIDGAVRVPQTATWVLAASPQNPDSNGPDPPPGQHLLTLVTCAEIFHTTDRLVVFGELIDTHPRESAPPAA